MKIILSILFLAFATINTFGQVAFRTYYTQKNKETKNVDEALYYRDLIISEGQNAPIQVIEKYVSTNKTKLVGLYNNMADKKFIGPKLQAYSNGKIKSKEKFSFDGALIDTAEYYHPNGKLRIAYQYLYDVKEEKTAVTDTLILIFRDSLGTPHLINGNGYVEEYEEDNLLNSEPHTIEKGNYDNHKRTGQWVGTFMKGKYSFIEEYKDGEIITGISKDSLNNTFSYDKNNFKKQPTYPGDIIALRKYVANNYQYPKEAVRNRINGTVRLSFQIDTEGKMTAINVDNDLGYGTGEASIKALKGAKKWTPGIMRGVPVKVAYTLPIRLNIN